VDAQLHTRNQAVQIVVALFWIVHYETERQSVTSRSQKVKVISFHHTGDISTDKCSSYKQNKPPAIILVWFLLSCE
jgi:hypothetical protein